MTRLISQFASLALLMLAASPACSGPKDSMALQLVLDTEAVDSGCVSSLCQAYGMSCGATVALRVSDSDTGAILTRATGEPLLTCLSALSGQDLCELRSLERALELPIPVNDVRIEVGLWSPDELNLEECERRLTNLGRFELFDVLGRPQPNFAPAPAFAAAAYVRAGEDGTVTLPLTCPAPEKLSSGTCSTNQPTYLEAYITDLETMQFVRRDQAENLSVSVGEARNISENPLEPSYTLDPTDTFDLELNLLAAAPRFNASIEQRFGDTICTVALEDVPQATATARCEKVIPSAPVLSLDGIYVPTEMVNLMLNLLGDGSFPSEGIIIGRVVDETLTPAPNVVLSLENGAEGNIFYLSEDLSELSQDATSSSAFFLATEVPFGTEWRAAHPDGRRQSGTPIGGLIRGKVSTVLIRMTGSVIGG